MTSKRKLAIIVFVALSISPLAALKPRAMGDAPATTRGLEKDGKPYDREYSLTKAQGEALALLLRLDLPDDTTVETKDYAPRSPGVRVLISAPKKVHDVVAPLVDLLVTEGAARNAASAFEIREKLEEAALLSEGIKKEDIQRMREQRERRRTKIELAN